MTEKKPKINIGKLSVIKITPRLQHIVGIEKVEYVKEYNADFQINLVPMFNIETNVIKIELGVIIDVNRGAEKYEKAAEFLFDFFYEYQTLPDLFDNQGELISEIFLICSNLSYSTLRGIIFAKSAKTCIEDILLPVVSGTELTKGYINSEIKKTN